MTSEQWAELVKVFGVPVIVLGVILWLFIRGKLHADTEYQELKKDRDWYRDIAYKATHAGEGMADVVKRVTADRDDHDHADLARRIVDELARRGRDAP